MRSTIAVASALALLVAQTPPGFAQNAVSPRAQPAAFAKPKALNWEDALIRPAIVDAFKAFPNGGDLLSKRLADLIVKDVKLAPGLVKYVQTTPGLNKEQKLAAERGLAAALQRLGVKAADMEPPVFKAPPPVQETYDPPYLLGLLSLLFIACVPCFDDPDGERSVTPHDDKEKEEKLKLPVE